MTALGPRPELLTGVLRWLTHHLDDFDPLADGIRPDPLRNKALAELAFFCDFTRRARPELNGTVERMLGFVANTWDRPEYQELAVRNPESLQLYALTYGSLLRCGVDVSRSAPIIQSVVDAGYATSVEAVPFRLMDLRSVLDLGGFEHPLATMEELYRQTMLASGPSLEYLTNADVYCLTHTIFYLTDFGFQPPALLGVTGVAEQRERVARLLGLYVRLRDWDLTAELLICSRCLASPSTAVEDAAWAALAHAQLGDGCVPAPNYDPENDDPFEHNYHTTLVAALAVLAAL